MKNILFFFLLHFSLILSGQMPPYEWAKFMGGTGNITPAAVTTDFQGNIYTTGHFSGQPDMDSDTGTYILNGPSVSSFYSDQFIAKTDAGGKLLWAKKFGNGNSYVYGFSISSDKYGNVYTTGYYEGIIQYPGGLVFNSGSGIDAFILKLDSSGNFIWARNLVDMDAKNIKTDALGNVWISGTFSGTQDFDPGPGVYPLTATTASFGTYSYLLKLNASGIFIRAKGLPCKVSGFDWDNYGNIVVAGSFTGTFDFDPGPGVVTLSSVSGSNANVAIVKLDAGGNFVWAKKVGAYWPMYAESIAVDPSGNLLFTGEFSGVVDFDPDSGVVSLSSLSGSYDIYVLKLNASGNFLWAKKMGGTSGDTGSFIDADLLGNVYTSGYFYNTVDFNPGTGVATLTTADPNAVGIFLSKLDSSGNYIGAGKAEAVNASTWPAFCINHLCEVYLTGVYKNFLSFEINGQTYPFSSGFNNYTRTFILKLKACESTSQNIFLCNGQEIIIGSHTYNSTGVYLDTLLNAGGNDSLLITCLTEYPESGNTLTLSVCSGDSVTIGNHTYHISGIYQDTLIAFTGCDSLITTLLTVKNPVEVSTYLSGSTLTSNAVNATYQWLDCNNGYSPVSGAVSQSFSPLSNGVYSVIVTQEECTDTSECVTVMSVGIENPEEFPLLLYPNPTQELLKVTLPEKGLKIMIMNTLGQTVYSLSNADFSQDINVSSYPCGIYTLMITNQNTLKASERFIKK